MPCFFIRTITQTQQDRHTQYDIVTVVLAVLLLTQANFAKAARPWDNPYQPQNSASGMNNLWASPAAPPTPSTPAAPPAPSVPSVPYTGSFGSTQPLGGIYSGIDPRTGDQVITVTPIPGMPVQQAPQYMPIYPQIFPYGQQQPVIPPQQAPQQPWQPPFVYRHKQEMLPPPPRPSYPPGITPGAPLRPSIPMQPGQLGPPPGTPGFVPQPRR